MRGVFSSLWWVCVLCILERSGSLPKASFSESSSPGLLAGDIAHSSVLGLGNLGCCSSVTTFDQDIFSGASMQAPVDRCFSARQRSCFCLGNATLLCCPPPYLQRYLRHRWCLERDGWLPSSECGREETNSVATCQGNHFMDLQKLFTVPSRSLWTEYQSTAMPSQTFIITSFVALC